MTEKRFTELWNDCSRDDKISMFRSYCVSEGCDDEFFEFDEEFFDMCFANKPMEAARAVCFGDVTWNDPYIKFDGYGNLESLSEYAAEDLCDEYIYTIWQHEDIWKDYIQEEDWRETGEELLTDMFDYQVNTDAIDEFLDNQWDESLDDEENQLLFMKWYSEKYKDAEEKLDPDYKWKNERYDKLYAVINFDGKKPWEYNAGLWQFIEDYWDPDKSDEENISYFKEWYKENCDEDIKFN